MNKIQLPYRIRRRCAIKKIKSKNIVSKDPLEQSGILIFNSLLGQKNTKLEIAPISFERTIENVENDIFIIFSDHKLTVIKNGHGNDIKISTTVQENLKARFDEVCEKRAQNSINRARKKIRHSLEVIVEELIQKKEIKE
jgi:hypothetical protein